VVGIKTMSEKRRVIKTMVVDHESDVTLFCKVSLEYYGIEVDAFNEPKKHCQILNQIPTFLLYLISCTCNIDINLLLTSQIPLDVYDFKKYRYWF
jgi:hypothetical protein